MRHEWNKAHFHSGRHCGEPCLPLKSFKLLGKPNATIHAMWRTELPSTMDLQSWTSTTHGLMRSPRTLLPLVCLVQILYGLSDVDTLVLHPYFKLAYIKLAWGGAEEQEAEHRKGNWLAKNWQDEAQKILERIISQRFHPHSSPDLFMVPDGTILEGLSSSISHCASYIH